MIKVGVFSSIREFHIVPKIGVWGLGVVHESQILTPIASYVFFKVLTKELE